MNVIETVSIKYDRKGNILSKEVVAIKPDDPNHIDALASYLCRLIDRYYNCN